MANTEYKHVAPAETDKPADIQEMGSVSSRYWETRALAAEWINDDLRRDADAAKCELDIAQQSLDEITAELTKAKLASQEYEEIGCDAQDVRKELDAVRQLYDDVQRKADSLEEVNSRLVKDLYAARKDAAIAAEKLDVAREEYDALRRCNIDLERMRVGAMLMDDGGVLLVEKGKQIELVTKFAAVVTPQDGFQYEVRKHIQFDAQTAEKD